MNKVIDLNKAREMKTQAEKIIEKKITTGEKLSQQEALTILMEMSGVVADMTRAIQQLTFQVNALEMHISTSSAREVALFKLLKEEKQLFTEEEFKAAWQKYVVGPMEEQRAKAKEAHEQAQKEALEKVKEEAKEASLEAAQTKSETGDTPDPAPVQEPTNEQPTGPVSQASE